MLTRFVASTAAPRDPIVDDPTKIEDVRCVVRLRGSNGDRELVIATELGGGIRVFDARDRLPQRARAQLSFHEVASGRRIELEADELHVFDLQTLEMLPDAPGPNDALYLYGAMRGPYPATLGTPVVAVDGQLTVTRSDLLGGLQDGVANAFAYAPDQRGARCVHALLPGERAEVIGTGRGIVLALPLVPGWLIDCPVPNDLIAAQIFYDVLSALRTDLGTSANAPPLPVPDRAAFERKLVAAGWRIEGDEAVRSRAGIGSLFRNAERRLLPRQGRLDELVAEAAAVLAGTPGVPTAECTAIRRRTVRSLAVAPVASAPVSPPPTGLPPTPPSAAPRPRVESDRAEWMKDFVDAHRSPSRPRPRVSIPSRVISVDAAPSWIGDFDAPDAATPDATGDAPTPPDWSKDFD